MRMLVTFSWDIEKANGLARKGTMGKIVGDILNDTKPECAYFTEVDGARGVVMVVNLDGLHELPKIAEPWFLAFNAKLTAKPAMIADDLAKAEPAIAAAAKKYA